MTLRAARPADRDQIIALHTEISQKSYAPFLSSAYLHDIMPAEKQTLWTARFAALGEPNTQITVCEIDGEVAGFACFQFDHQPEFGSYLHNLFISSRHQGGGIGRTLIHDAIARFAPVHAERPLHLVAYGANHAACRFYERLGGQIIERGAREQSDGPPAEILRYGWASAQDLALATGPAKNGV